MKFEFEFVRHVSIIFFQSNYALELGTVILHFNCIPDYFESGSRGQHKQNKTDSTEEERIGETFL